MDCSAKSHVSVACLWVMFGNRNWYVELRGIFQPFVNLKNVVSSFSKRLSCSRSMDIVFANVARAHGDWLRRYQDLQLPSKYCAIYHINLNCFRPSRASQNFGSHWTFTFHINKCTMFWCKWPIMSSAAPENLGSSTIVPSTTAYEYSTYMLSLNTKSC